MVKGLDSPTIHIPTEEEPVTVNFKVASDSQVFFGVLCHRQELGDKCFISSFHIAKSTQTASTASRGSFKSIQYTELIAHQNTNLSVGEGGQSSFNAHQYTRRICNYRCNSQLNDYHFLACLHILSKCRFLYAADANSGSN